MRVLVACEFSGTVRDAFIAAGHDAMSCDLLPTEKPGPHYQGDVLDILHGMFVKEGGTEIIQPWDLMIAHPPCTYLSVSGLHWNKRVPGRQQQTDEALEFVRMLMNAPIERICVENPVSCISTKIRKPDQVIQPWHFGHDASKKTCLWLKNLPKLVETDRLPGNDKTRRANQTPSGQNKLGPSPDRWKERSKTYPGIAAAMAMQWGNGEVVTARRHATVDLWSGHDAYALGTSPIVATSPFPEWKKVVFSADCDEDGNCPVCGDVDFGDCECPGPTQEEEYEYIEVDGDLYARRLVA